MSDASIAPTFQRGNKSKAISDSQAERLINGIESGVETNYIINESAENVETKANAKSDTKNSECGERDTAEEEEEEEEDRRLVDSRTGDGYTNSGDSGFNCIPDRGNPEGDQVLEHPRGRE
ncbi:hypothetical protein QQS21_011021 [Conoideocrella luteorostrata]|uniref:Uncharacterized protein n=1 Tax=Conoideocrella luteorostrata TaxID=1105319 RepID=A0AAJ0CG88_9HYPO|nr:hypothetical protein QQS21_011021 [Conoideocrella luteorostrata]